VSPGISEDPFALQQRDERGGPCFFLDTQALIATSDNATTNSGLNGPHAQRRFGGVDGHRMRRPTLGRPTPSEFESLDMALEAAQKSLPSTEPF
jgi:hypothetical protein